MQLIQNRKSRALWFILAFFGILLCAGMIYGHKNIAVSNTGESDVQVRIVQPVTSQAKKIALSRADAWNIANTRVDDLVTLAGDVGDIDLVVYPETVYPFVLKKYDDQVLIANKLHKPVIVGSTVFDNGLVYNSLVLAGANGDVVDIYNKSHLVPFGEYGPIKFVPAPAN